MPCIKSSIEIAHQNGPTEEYDLDVMQTVNNRILVPKVPSETLLILNLCVDLFCST